MAVLMSLAVMGPVGPFPKRVRIPNATTR